MKSHRLEPDRGELRQGLATGAATPWSRSGAKWFKMHRRRAHRVRAAFPGEMKGHPYDPLTDRIVVRQTSRGVRMRERFRVAECAADTVEMQQGLRARAEHSEGAAHLMFDLATEHAERLILPAELTEMIRLYEAGGGAMN
jgi:hypothetical protein